jgi:signal peptidase II
VNEQPAPTDASGDIGGAWRSGRAWATLIGAAAVGIALDLVTKSLAFQRVAGGPVDVQRADVLALPPQHINDLVPAHNAVTVVPHVLDLRLVLNPGAVFGVGAGRRSLFIAFAAFAIGFGLWMFARWTRPRNLAAHLGIGLVLAGGLGNLYDRLLFGCVRDFLHPLPTLRWPGGGAVWPYVSNVADALLLVGIGIVLAHLWRADRTSHEPVASPRAPTPPG